MRLVLIMVGFVLYACAPKQEANTDKENTTQVETEQKVIKGGVSQDLNARLTAINEKIRGDLKNPDLYIKRSSIYSELSDEVAALEDLNRAFGIDSTYLPTLLAQADFILKRGQITVSMAVLEKAQKLYPESSSVYTKMGEVYLVAKNLEKALKSADEAIRYDKFNAQAYYVKGYTFLEMGDTAKAISSYQTAVEQDPDHFDAFLELGLIHLEMNDPLALDYLKNALKIKPTEKRALYSKGMYEQEHKMYNEAIQTYTDAVKAHPNFREAHHNLGYVHMYYLKLYKEATMYFTRAIKVDPNYYEAIYNRGYCLELMGDIRNSEKDYVLALSINPSYDLAAKGLSRLRGDK